MQQGKHTEYEKHLHEEMLLNQSTAASDSPNMQNTDNRTNQQNLQLPPEKQASQNNCPQTAKSINSISPITAGGVDIGVSLDSGGSRSEVTGTLSANSSSLGNGSDFTHNVNNTGQGGLPLVKDIIDTKIHNQHHHHHHNSGNNREQHSKGTISGTIHKNTNSHSNNMVNSRTPSPKGTLQNGHIDRVGGAVSSTSTGMSSTSCGSVGSTTSNESSNTSISSSGGSALGLWHNIDRGSNSARKWNDSPDSLR